MLINPYIQFPSGGDWTANNNILSPRDTDLISYYNFDSDSADSAGSSDGTDSNITYAAAKYNNGAVFNGSTAQISIGAINNNGATSFSFWFNSDNTGSGRTLFQTSIDSTGFIIFMDAGGIRFGFRGGDKWDIGGVSASTIYHLVLTYDGGSKTSAASFAANLNGSSQTITDLGNIGGSASDTYFGSEGGAAYYDGWLDEFARWGVELSAAEMTALYNSGTGAFYRP